MSSCRLLYASGLVAASIWLAGCHSPNRTEPQGAPARSFSAPSADGDRLWATAEETLRSQRLPLDRLDRRNGVMTTLPEMSQHFFEFWRHDVATAHDWAESGLNPIRRWVEVALAPQDAGDAGDAGDSICLSVVVHKERLSSPDRQFNNSGAALQYFGTTLPSTTGAVRVTTKDDRWIDLGRDPAMEDRILAAITRRFETAPPQAAPVPAEPDTPENK